MPVTEYSDKDLLKRAMRGARSRECGEHPRWVAVMDVFSLGSTYAHELCRLFDLDPDEKVQGARCISCNP